MQLFTLTKTLTKKFNVPVSVVLLNHGELEKRLLRTDVKVIVLDETRFNGLQILRRLISIIRELEPDIVHTHRSKENILGSIAASLAGGIPSLRTTHGAPEHQPDWWHIPKRIIRFLDWLSERYLQKTVIAVSDDLATILKKYLPSKKITVIENGIDLDEVRDTHKNLQNHSVRHDLFRVGFAGRLTPVKRVDIFILTAKYLLDHRPEFNASFHIFGDGPLRDELEDLSKQLGTSSIVTFEGHCEDIYGELRELDALLITSDHEGLPMVLLEAIALEIPVIAHAVGGITKVLDNGSCSILIESQNAPEFGNAIYQLASSPQMQMDLKSNALERVNRYYSADQNALKYLSAYSIIQSARSARKTN
ncbi:MAG: glycosyltransferase [Gammaproteobacteria bacterium]